MLILILYVKYLGIYNYMTSFNYNYNHNVNIWLTDIIMDDFYTFLYESNESLKKLGCLTFYINGTVVSLEFNYNKTAIKVSCSKVHFINSVDIDVWSERLYEIVLCEI